MGQTLRSRLGKGQDGDLKMIPSTGIPTAQVTALFNMWLERNTPAGLHPEPSTEMYRRAGPDSFHASPSMGRTAGMCLFDTDI